ncbi:hypothetical protein [Methylobacterium nigriterrae]|uniref:hypothetical protein n=1 Tax=Methylobacterium nigriterrae TaxID=3127512 RepID=UPI003013AFC2
MSKIVTVIALTAVLSTSLLFPASAAEPKNFNGSWTVELVTESGLCDSRYSYSLAVQEGQVRLKLAVDGTTRITGRVGQDGTVGLNVSNGSTNGAASGRLQAQSGAGTWKVSSLCSGRWTARRLTLTAQGS